MNFVAQLQKHAAVHPDREAVCGEGFSLGYRELVELVEQRADAFVEIGLGPASTIGLSVGPEFEHFVASLALIWIGARQITLATHDTAVERASIAERARVTHIVSSDGLVTVPERGKGSGQEVGWTEGEVLLRTSGTTGDMNIVPLTGTDIGIQAERNPEYDGGRLFRPASIEHNNSKRHRLYCAFMGGTNVLRPEHGFDTAAFCAEHSVTSLDLSLMQAADLALGDHRERLGTTELRVSGSAVPIDVRRRIEERVTRQLYVRYGSTETGTISFAGPGEHDEAESVGVPVPGLTLEIVGGDGQGLGVGETGHIRLRGVGIARGYLDTPAQTAARFREGWFRPGDMGSVRSDGSLIVKGRADDMIILNGINVFPAEIERVLERHPDVGAAAALPLRSSMHGQIPVAAVEVRPGSSITSRELLFYAREQLALRAPRRIIIVGALPRNSQGKVIRRELAARFEMQPGRID